jgi:hypothetical protein
MNKKVNRTGEKYISSRGQTYEIIEYFTCMNCTIRFDDGLIQYNKRYDHVRAGDVKNLFYPSIFGIGFLGADEYKKAINGIHTREYYTWKNMLKRCYDVKYKERNPTYKDVTICEEWHNFQNFATWFEENYNPEIMQGWHLDKDILFKGNKIYSTKTCCFVPQEINALFTKNDKSRGNLPIGVTKEGNKFITKASRHNTPEEAFEAYKITKEKEILHVANKWKSSITDNCYKAMYNYQVEITD